MDLSAIVALVNNVALLLGLGVLYDIVGYRPRGRMPSLRQGIMGIALGMIGIVIMSTPWELSPGLLFDARSVLFGVSGLFLGTVPTMLAAFIAGAFRLYLGGAGAWTGAGLIFISGLVGIGWRHLRKGELNTISLKELYLLGLVVHVIMLLWMLTLPSPLPLIVLSEISIPVMVIHPVATALLGWLLLSRQKRMQAEKALSHSENQLRLVTDNLPAFVSYIGMDDLQYRFVNGKFEEAYKMSREQIIGSHIQDIIGKENYQFAKKHLDIVRQGQVSTYENRFITAGTERWVSVNYVPDIDAQGNVNGIVVLGHDITERKRAALELSQQKALFEAIFACIPDAIVYTNINREVVAINPAFSSILGYGLDDLEGKKTSFFYESLDEYERQGKIRFNLTADERALPYEVNYRRKDGSVFTGETLGTVVKSTNGEIMGYIGVIRDITERKQAEMDLRKSRESFLSLVNNMLDGIYRSTHDGKFVDINPAMVKMFGFSSKEEMLDVDIKNELYFTPDERGSHVLDTGQEETEVYRMRRKDGSEIWVEDHGRYVHDEQGNIIYHEGILRDITERRAAELAIKKANEQLHAQLAEIKELQIALRAQALRDPLTGLFNRRYLVEALQKEVARAARNGKPFSVVMLDLDNLKEINDLYGHVAGGDKALQALTQKIQSLCRASDTFCRYAGDEFVLLLSEASLQSAYKRALEWREAIAKIKITLEDDEFSFTFSAGIAEYPTHGTTGNQLIQQADKALYQAKKQGRNQVVMREKIE